MRSGERDNVDNIRTRLVDPSFPVARRAFTTYIQFHQRYPCISSRFQWSRVPDGISPGLCRLSALLPYYIMPCQLPYLGRTILHPFGHDARKSWFGTQFSRGLSLVEMAYIIQKIPSSPLLRLIASWQTSHEPFVFSPLVSPFVHA